MVEFAYAPLKIVVCPACGYMGELGGLKMEYGEVPQQVELTCPKCGAKVPMEAMATHMVKHLRVGGKTYTCDICQARIQGEGKALRHMKEHFVAAVRKGGVLIWVCLICGRTFRYRTSVLAHISSFHGREL